MLNPHLVLLLAAMVTPAQDAEMPEAWKLKIEAAAKAEESHHPVQAEALLIDPEGILAASLPRDMRGENPCR